MREVEEEVEKKEKKKEERMHRNRFFFFFSPTLTSVTRKSMTIAFRAAGATRAARSLAAHSSREMVRSSGPPAWKEFIFC